MKLPLLLVAGLLLRTIAQPAAAQLLDPGFASPTSLYTPGTISALGPQQADDKRLVAGTFSRVNGTALAGLVRLDAAGMVDQAFAQNLGTANNIYRIRSYGAAGQYLLGAYGGNVTAGGISRVELLRLNATGTADASFNVGNGPSGGYGYVNEFAVQPDGKVIVTGSFDTFSGTAAAGVARLNANGSLDASFNVGTGLDANAPDYSEGATVAVQADGKILVGGYFSVYGGQPSNGLVRLNANGTFDTSFAPALSSGSSVEGIVVQPDGKVLVNGYIILNGSNIGLVRLLPTGALDPSFSTTSLLGSSVSTSGLGQAVVLQPDGKIVASGYFNAANGRTNVVRLNPDGTLDASFQAPSGNVSSPNALGLQANGSVLLAGSPTISLTSENSSLRLSSTGTIDPTFAPVIQSPGRVTAVVAQPDGRVIVGGNFTELNGQAVHRVARLSSSGTLEASYSAATGLLPGPVTTLLLQPDGKALVGTSAGSLRLLAGGSPDPGFAPFLSSNVYAMALQPDGRIMMATSAVSSTYRYLVRLTSSGAYDPSFVRPVTSAGTGLPGVVDGVVMQPDGRIVVSESFSTPGQQPVERVVRYLASGALDASFDYSTTFTTSTFTPRLYALALQADGKLLVGGNQTLVNGAARTGAVRLNATGGLDASFAPNFSFAGTLYNLTVQPNGRILLGGSFSGTGSGVSLSNLGRVLANGQADASFGNTVDPNGQVRTIAIQSDGGILLAGSFTTLGGQPAVGIARIVAANVLAVAAPTIVATRTSAWPVPAHGQLHVAPDASAGPQSIELLDALGRSQRRQPATAAAEQTLDLAGLPAGLYLLRVHYAAGEVTRRVTVE